MNAPTPSLRELQKWLRWLLTHPLGVEGALAPASSPDLDERFDEPAHRWLNVVSSSHGASRERRLAIYADGYFSQALEALAADYPAVRNILGERRFREVTARLLLAHPPTSFTLADLGEGLPRLLAALLGPEEPTWLPELALLERAAVEVAFFEVPAPLDPARLPSSPEAWEGARVLVPPTLRLLRLSHAVDTVWRSAAEGRPPATPPPREERSLVLGRDASGLWLEALPRDAWEVLADVRGGKCLGTICAQLAETEGDPERVTRWFQDWMDRGWFAGVVFRNGVG